MRGKLFFVFVLVGWIWATEVDFLSLGAGFVGTHRMAPLYESPSGREILNLPPLQSVDVLAKTNMAVLSGTQTWYQVAVQLSSENQRKHIGWVRSHDLFSEQNFQFVKKIMEWYLLVEYPDVTLVFHVQPNGRVRCFENGEIFEDRLRMFESVFLLGRAMLYYDGRNPPIVPWSSRVEVITNRELFPLEEDLREPMLREYVLTADRVNLRDAPSTNSQIITRLAKGRSVLVRFRVGKPERIGGKRGYWTRVVVVGNVRREGYVFGAYIEEKR